MKNKLFYLVVITTFCCLKSFGQNFYFETIEGNKIQIEPNSVKIGVDYDNLLYTEKGKVKSQTIQIKNIKSAVADEFRLNSFLVGKKNQPCFVVAESKTKKLVGYYKVVIINKHDVNIPANKLDIKNPVSGDYIDRNGTNRGRDVNVITNYHFYVLDSENNVLDELKFDDRFFKASAEERDKAEAILRKHFSDCPSLIAILNQYDVKMMDLDNASKTAKKAAERIDNANAKVFKVFDYPKYINCDEVFVETAISKKEIVNNLEDLLKDVNGKYNFGAITAQVGPSKKEIGVTGFFLIKDGFLYTETKDNKTKYPITNYKDGVIYCSDRDMIHTMKIVSESGKKKGFAYTTRVIFTADKKIGGTVADYWCVKE